MPERFTLRLSKIAEDDLASIYEYGFRQWGERQAELYYDTLISHLNQLCAQPFLYAAVDHIRPGYRRSVSGAHSIYYRIVDHTVEIMAVIGRQDFQNRL